jgi:hypothetical protein
MGKAHMTYFMSSRFQVKRGVGIFEYVENAIITARSISYSSKAVAKRTGLTANRLKQEVKVHGRV